MESCDKGAVCQKAAFGDVDQDCDAVAAGAQAARAGNQPSRGIWGLCWSAYMRTNRKVKFT
jgi:hypothetical protein